MYNGIGLSTVRGSGTNGYVQRNTAHISKGRAEEKFKTEAVSYTHLTLPTKRIV